jgi:hypothetical protein
MNAATTLIGEITAEINALQEGSCGEAILDPPCREWHPPLDAWMGPEPDVLREPDDPEVLRRIAEERRLLGGYVPMQSPGQVVLVRQNLRHFYWALICTLHPRVPYVTKSDLVAALELVVMKTYHHERFHHASDVFRQLFDSPFDPLLEEALAVAWARRTLIQTRAVWNSKIGRMNGLLYRLLMHEAFAYTSPGYQDWPLYADDSRLLTALLDYLAPPNHAELLANGVDLGPLVLSMIDNVSGGYSRLP